MALAAVDDNYSVASGGAVRAGLSGWPAWRTALAAWQWYEIPGTAMSNTVPSPAPTGGAANRVEAWNGIAVLGMDVYLAGVGGHDDYWGNEAYKIATSADSPGAPILLRQPTPAADYLTDTDYFADGRPTSSHTYYALQSDQSRNRIFRFGVGSGCGTGNHITPNVDAFNLTLGDWDAADFWADVPESISNGLSICKHRTTGDVYIAGASKMWRWNRSDASFTILTDQWPTGGNGTATAARASLIDTVRNRLVVLGNSYATPAGVMILDLSNNTWSTATLTGALASMVAAQAGNAAHYDVGLDKYLVRRSWAAAGDPPTFLAGGEILLVDPVTWAVTALATTGGSGIPATNAGVFGLLQQAPELAGYFFLPTGTSNLRFLAGEQ